MTHKPLFADDVTGETAAVVEARIQSWITGDNGLYDMTGKTTAQINTWLAAASPFSTDQKIKRLVGEHASTAPLVVQDNTYLDLTGAVIVRDFSATGNANGTFVNADQVGGGENITIVGGTVGANSAKAGKHFSFVGVDGLNILFTNIVAVYDDFMGLYKNCTRTHTFGARWDGGDSGGEDGLHIYGGSYHTVNGCHIFSGDDSLSFTTENVDNLPMSHIEVNDVVLVSRDASEIKIYAQTQPITHINISNVGIDHPGANAGSAIRLLDEFSDTTDDGCWDVKLNQVSIDMNGSTAYAVRAAGIDSLTLDEFDVRNLNNLALYVTGGTGPTASPICRNFRSTGFRAYDQAAAGKTTIQLDDCEDFDLLGFMALNPTAHGVTIGGSSACTGGRVAGGLVDGSPQSGIRLANGSTYVTVEDNRVRGCTTIFSEAGASDYNVFARNDVRGNTATSFTPSGANSSAFDNVGIADSGGSVDVAPAVVIPPAGVLLANAAAVFSAADRAIFARFTLTMETTLRYVNWAVGVASGNVQVGIVSLHGSGHGSYTRIVDTGIIACPASGTVRTDLGATVLPAGDYAVFLWADNTTLTVRMASNAALAALQLTPQESSIPGGVGSTGSIAWGQIAWNVTLEGDI